MRWRKILVSSLLALAVILNTVSLGWSIAQEDRYDIIVYSLHIAFALYAFLVAIRAIGQDNVEYHSESVIHLTTLLTTAFALLGITAILPSYPSPIAAVFAGVNVLLALWHTLIAIYFVSCILCFTTPMGPPLHYPPEHIYSEKTVQSITNKDEENVCGIISMFVSFFASHVQF